jgi:WD40 repeat protein
MLSLRCGCDDSTLGGGVRATRARFAGGAVDSVVFSPDGTLLANGVRHGNVRLWSVGQGTLIGIYLSLPGGEWLTYIPQGYYIGSKDVEKRVVMKFERDGLLYPAELFQRDNPNPQKVAEALRG